MSHVIYMVKYTPILNFAASNRKYVFAATLVQVSVLQFPLPGIVDLI